MAKVATKKVNEFGVRFQFADGRILDCDLRDLTEDMIFQLAKHGAAQKIGDSYAGAESIEQAYCNANEVYGNLMNGLWTTRATGGKLVEALARATGKSIDECFTKLNDMSDEEIKELKKHPAIKKALADMEVERLAKITANGADDGTDLSVLFQA